MKQYTINGKTQSLEEWSAETGLGTFALAYRIKNWPEEDWMLQQKSQFKIGSNNALIGLRVGKLTIESCVEPPNNVNRGEVFGRVFATAETRRTFMVTALQRKFQ
jgi:hypothetical protein